MIDSVLSILYDSATVEKLGDMYNTIYSWSAFALAVVYVLTGFVAFCMLLKWIGRRLISGERFSSRQRRKKGFQIGNPDTWYYIFPIVSRETLDSIPEFRLQFRQLFPAETIKHLVIEGTEEQAAVLELVCIGDFPRISGDDIPKNVKPHGKPKAFTLNVIKLFSHTSYLYIGIGEPLRAIVNIDIIMAVICEKVAQIRVEIFPIPAVTNERYLIYQQKAVTIFILTQSGKIKLICTLAGKICKDLFPSFHSLLSYFA